MRWFVEERTMLGTWTPATYHSKEPPSEKGIERRVKFRRPPVAVAAEHIELDLQQLQAIYGVNDDNPVHH